MQEMNDDMIIHIFQNVFYLQLLDLCLCCRTFNRLIDKFSIKKQFMNNIFIARNIKYIMMEEKSIDDLLYPSSFHNSWNYMSCCNVDCISCEDEEEYDNGRSVSFKDDTITTVALGVSYFYYPENLTPTYNGSDIYEKSINLYTRLNECRDVPYIKRLIPYCYDCMKKYVVFQERKDLQEIPYSTSRGGIDN